MVTFYSATNLYFSYNFNGGKYEDYFYKTTDKLIAFDKEIDKNYSDFRWAW